MQQLVDGRWGVFFLGSVIGPNLVVGGAALIPAQIDRIFEWGGGVARCEWMRAAYAQAIIDLLTLPTGQALIQDIITTCHNNYNYTLALAPATVHNVIPHHLVFINDRGSSGLVHVSKKPYQCELNLECSDNTGKRILEGHNVLLVRDVAANSLGFVGVATSPAFDLAHELGHFLYALNSPRVPLPAGPGGGVRARTVHLSVEDRAQAHYRAIFAGVGGAVPMPPAERAFVDLWNGGVFSEAVNILPSASILNNAAAVAAAAGIAAAPAVPVGFVGGGLNYSDGIMIGEAFHTWPLGDPRLPIFFNLAAGGVGGVLPVAAAGAFVAGAGNINLNAAGGGFLPKWSFVRFSHGNTVDFFNVFSALDNVPDPVTGLSDRDEFKNLVVALLGKIDANGGPPLPPGGFRGLTIADLPQI
ncbi:MAG: hypothetical protein LBF34_01255 [Puniceicoccales bacterium]|jgi:hypothetical protein|nr:hypothetical protein [Puniceicoccales bacterium]